MRRQYSQPGRRSGSAGHAAVRGESLQHLGDELRAASANAILALNAGAQRGGRTRDTGEGSIRSHYRVHAGDLVLEIGSGYFGCRGDDGRFDADKFRANVLDPQVRMVELKRGQGAKPGHGGVLPGPKVSREIAAARSVPVGEDCVSPAAHRAFSTPVEMLRFLQRQRALVVPDTAARVWRFHQQTLEALRERLQATGLRASGELQPAGQTLPRCVRWPTPEQGPERPCRLALALRPSAAPCR